MDDVDMRFECVRLAIQMAALPGGPVDIEHNAKKMYDWVTNKQPEPPGETKPETE